MSIIEQITVPPGERGKWRVSRFDVGDKDSESTALRAMFKGRGYVPAGTYTQLTCAGRGVVMSDTPDERRDHTFAAIKAKGHVLINGLGLGMVLGAILGKPEVERVTVVEIDPDVIALVGPHYACDRLEIVAASAYDYAPPKGVRYGAIWHDIWDGFCTDNLPQMTKLKRKYGRRTDWQGCWGEEWCKRHAKSERRWR